MRARPSNPKSTNARTPIHFQKHTQGVVGKDAAALRTARLLAAPLGAPAQVPNTFGR